MAAGTEARTCDHCGQSEDDPAALLTWSTAVERGKQKWFCTDCSRRHLRSMEGKLDSEWW